MRKILFILVIGLLCQQLPAGEGEDLTFILGLYRDGNYQLAATEMTRFLNHYSQSEQRLDVIFLLANACLQIGDYTQARQHFLTLYKQPDIFPQLGEVVFGLGQTEYYLRNLSQAESYFQEFLKKYPRHQLRSQVYYFLGRLYLDKGDLSKAENNLRDAGKLGLDNRLQVARVELDLARNKPVEARKIVLSLLESAPQEEYTAQSLLLYQKYNLEQGQIGEILATGYDRISPSSRYYREYQLLLAIAHYQRAEYELALNRLQNLDSALAVYYRGLCYFEINNWDAARPLFSSLLQAEDMKIRTNSSFYLIRMLPDQNQAVSRFHDFIQANPGHPLLGAAHFQKGVLLFKLRRYQEAIADFDTALQKGTDTASREKAVYLKAESQFLLEQEIPAYASFQEYLKAFPQGIFTDQALFKLGLYHYHRSEYPEAFIKFDQLVTAYPESDKIGMSHFYQGEIFYRQEKYQEAERYFTQAALGIADQGYINLRLAQIRYLRKQYSEALELLRSVPDEQRYLYEKLLLEGNCRFALNQNQLSLNALASALEYAPDQAARDQVLSRQAWVLYKLNRFREATEIYAGLARNNDKRDEYLIKAATSAFSAEDYPAALNFFREYLTSYPDGKDAIPAKVGIANSHYNLGDFANAAGSYEALIYPGQQKDILDSALNGLQWSCDRADELDFTIAVEALWQQYDNRDLRVRLISRLAFYHYDKQQWSQTVKAVDRYEELVSTGFDPAIVVLKAEALMHTGEYDLADRTFQRLQSSRQRPEVLYRWAQLKFLLQEEKEGISKLRQASSLTSDPGIWLLLLEKESLASEPLFLDDYHKFLVFATAQDKEQAMVYRVRYQLQAQEYQAAHASIEELLVSKYKPIRAQAQFLKGYKLYLQQDYEQAVPELLRVRYLYPENSNTRVEAEAYACLAYLAAGKITEADQLYEIIHPDLPPDLKSLIEQARQGSQK